MNLTQYKNSMIANGLNTKFYTKLPHRIKLIEEDKDILDDLEDSEAELDDKDFDFKDDDEE